MEEVTLTEAETRYYSDLFACCDVEKSGKIPWPKAKELFHSANISNESVVEITSLAGIPSAALHISRAQFYSCLKLIAAHQAALPLRQELIAATVQLALPRFSWKDAASCINLELANGLSALPPPPPTDRRNSLQRRNDVRRSSQQQDALNSDLPSTDSEVDQNESSCGGGGSSSKCVSAGGSGVTSSSSRETHRRRADGGSPEAWSTNSDSPTPTNSVAERPWAKDTLWHGLLGDEHRQLLGTEEESSDRHSSDEEDNENELVTLYQITSEQRDYYYKQFKAVQRDPNGLLSGQAARIFFEKSRIPVEELRHIWQLCDVTRDGALSLSEFTAAMHLVVLRRNNIPLPNVLPPCLHPNVLQHTGHISHEPPEADLLHLNDDDDDDNTDNTIISGNLNNSSTITARSVPIEKNKMNLSTISTTSQASSHSRQNVTPPLPPPVKTRSISNSPSHEKPTTPQNMAATAGTVSTASSAIAAASISKNKEQPQKLWIADVPSAQWTKFSESPTTTTTVSSPGLKPVNFDIKRTTQEVVSNPQILHPVPLRVTPVASAVSAGGAGSTDVSQHQTAHDDSTTQLEGSSTKSSINHPVQQHHRDSTQNNDLRAIQRPQAKKLPGKNIGALPPPPQREPSIGAGDAAITSSELANNQTYVLKKEPPPLPPPRPHRHARSSSLDLNKFKMSASNNQQPEITAQASFDLQTSTGFADFTHFPEDSSAAANVSDSTHEQQQHSLPPVPAAPTIAAMPPTRMSLQSNQRVSAFEIYRKPNTPRNSQSPPIQLSTSSQQQKHYSQQPTQPPPPAPFGSVGAAALSQPLPPPVLTAPNTVTTSTISALPNADLFEKRVTAISETLRHVSFKQNEHSMPDILRRLREQNNLLLRLCNDLSDELLTVQTRKEEMRLKLESVTTLASSSGVNAPDANQMRTISSISAPVTANVTGGSSGSAGHTNV